MNQIVKEHWVVWYWYAPGVERRFQLPVRVGLTEDEAFAFVVECERLGFTKGVKPYLYAIEAGS